jgi:hypothetical protein
MAGARDIMRRLEVHPELRRIPEVLRQQKGGLRCDTALAAHQFIDAVQMNTQSAGTFCLSQPQR